MAFSRRSSARFSSFFLSTLESSFPSSFGIFIFLFLLVSSLKRDSRIALASLDGLNRENGRVTGEAGVEGCVDEEKTSVYSPRTLKHVCVREREREKEREVRSKYSYFPVEKDIEIDIRTCLPKEPRFK